MSSALRTAYAWILLSVIVLPLFPAMFVLRPILNRTDPSGDRFRRLTAQWVSLYARFTPLYRFTLEGIQHVPNTGPYILVANHESGLDVLALLLLGAPVRFLAETWMFRIPLAGWLFRACRHIPVKPRDRETGHKALAAAEEALAEGTPVAIFPEGRLCPDGLGEFKPGAFVLAARTRVPLIPVVLEGTGEAWRPGTVVVHGAHEIRIRVLEPLEAGASETRDDLARRTRELFETSRSRGGAAKAAAQTT